MRGLSSLKNVVEEETSKLSQVVETEALNLCCSAETVSSFEVRVAIMGFILVKFFVKCCARNTVKFSASCGKHRGQSHACVDHVGGRGFLDHNNFSVQQICP